MALTFAACGGNAAAPTAPTGTSDAPPASLGDGTGKYEGEMDDGLFSGYGVWMYRNFRYEGYFEKGMPNGEGTLYEALEVGPSVQGESEDPSQRVVSGQWMDGIGDGTMTITDVHDGYTNVWEIAIEEGLSTVSGRIEGVCSGPEADTQPVWWPMSEGFPLAFVPPWGRTGFNDLPAPTGNGNAPTVAGPLPDATPSAPPVPVDAADISELVLDEEAISLSAKLNGDGTITYTYQDTSIQPAYTSDRAAAYFVSVNGTMEDSMAVTGTSFHVESQVQGGTNFLDLSSLTGYDTMTEESIPVTIDDNGLSMTWTTKPYGGRALDELGAFYISLTLDVGGEYVFREQLILGMEVLQ